MAVFLITRDYRRETEQETLPVVVEFFASWCPKCSMMKDVVENLARMLEGKILFKKADIDQLKDTAGYLGVEIVPTFIVYKNGEIMGYTTGVLPGPVLERRITDMLNV